MPRHIFHVYSSNYRRSHFALALYSNKVFRYRNVFFFRGYLKKSPLPFRESKPYTVCFDFKRRPVSLATRWQPYNCCSLNIPLKFKRKSSQVVSISHKLSCRGLFFRRTQTSQPRPALNNSWIAQHLVSMFHFILFLLSQINRLSNHWIWPPSQPYGFLTALLEIECDL